MNIDKLAIRVEDLIDEVKSLCYKFPSHAEDAAEEEKNAAIEALELWLEIATDCQAEVDEEGD